MRPCLIPNCSETIVTCSVLLKLMNNIANSYPQTVKNCCLSKYETLQPFSSVIVYIVVPLIRYLIFTGHTVCNLTHAVCGIHFHIHEIVFPVSIVQICKVKLKIITMLDKLECIPLLVLIQCRIEGKIFSLFQTCMLYMLQEKIKS